MASALRWYYHPTVITLLGANLLAMLAAMYERWNVAQVFWMFWMQSVVIGVTYLLEALLDDPAVKRVSLLDKIASGISNLGSAMLFLLYYGGFHFVYALTLMKFDLWMPDLRMNPLMMLAVVGFVVSQVMSFVLRRRRGAGINDAGIGPIARILPMHLGLVLGAAFGGMGMILVMMGMKTVFDVAMEVFSVQSAKK